MEPQARAKKEMKTLVQRLLELAEDANNKANLAIGVDREIDAFHQGRRNAFNNAAELAEELCKTEKCCRQTIAGNEWQ